MDRIPVAGPSITEKEVSYVADAVRTAWYANSNAYQERFEKAFAAYLNVRYAVALPSCTAAIHLALAALGVGPGDEVIVPELTWIASAAPVSYVGATPVFGDVDELSWCLSVESLERCITPATKAVIPVDLYGGMADYSAMLELCRRRNLAVVEDAAEAIGSDYQGRRAGSLGDVGVFSFHGSKTLTTGEGGMLVTDREDLYRRVLVLRDHGRRPGDRMFFNGEVAFKYKMSSMQAALGLAQLERVDELVEAKRQTFAWYRRELANTRGLRLNAELPGTKNSYWMVTVVLDDSYDLPKEKVMQLLEARSIDSRPFFHPLSSLPAYAGSPWAGRARSRNSVSYRVSRQGVNLPCALNMTEAKVIYVCDELKRILAASASS